MLICRVQILCDTDEEDENIISNGIDRNLRGRKLLFSDNESSQTSEFDPEDFVLPKITSKKSKEYNKIVLS